MEHHPAAGRAGAVVVVDLQPERFEHPAAQRVWQRRDLTPPHGESIDEVWVLRDRRRTPVSVDLCLLGADLVIELGDPCLDSLDESTVGVVCEFESVELAVPSLSEVLQDVM
ncbi:hypothetical protein ACQEU8_33105 [Streptomyces sp. CA-250714]|uniref:hypothetical protein n=1 Tax=Streptomyces sp. CA-250714 TaxID=3240060 RepID=UPI003D945373